jgi:hypothetical protein
MKLENLEIIKLTVHKIFGRSKTVAEAYAGECKELVKLGSEGMDILKSRISSCINHKSKFYELDLVEEGENSFFDLQAPLWGSREPKFLKISQSIADKAAEAHKNANIPDGLLMVVEAKISTFKTVIVVKAEKSDAFSMKGTDLQLVKDIFLSSDKTLYKVGFFLKRIEDKEGKNAYKYFVYDDAFSPSKGDLAHYFYNTFLGLSTEKNSKLLTNKFHRSLSGFIQDHIDFGDKYELLRTIDRAFIDPNRKSINATDFKDFFPDELHPLFHSQIVEEFPNAFIKDNSITTSIDTKRIALSESTTLLLRNAPDGIITGNTANKTDMAKLRATIDSGNLTQNYNYALIPSAVPVKQSEN